MEEFKLTEAHLKLLSRAYVGWESCEYGAPSIDCKRPYGNSNVEPDIAEIIGIPYPEDVPESLGDYLRKLHEETQTALQIVLCTKSFVPGVYIQSEKYKSRSWILKK